MIAVDSDRSVSFSALSLSDPVVVVSGDTHIGPRLVQDLRPYCPQKYLARYDDFAQHKDEILAQANLKFFGTDPHQSDQKDSSPLAIQLEKNSHTQGHYDMHARLADYNRDGVAAAVLLHGSQNGQPIPFRTSVFESCDTGDDHELSAVGYHIYNQWLADVCTIEPERHVGMAYVPLWDIAGAVKELEWARKAGLRAIHLPAPIANIREYNRPEWEPFWCAVETNDMALLTHGGQDTSWQYSGPEANVIQLMEGGGWMVRRHIHWMAYSGVFYRHPKLRLVITEISGNWLSTLGPELDGPWLSPAAAEARKRVPELPSEAARRCVYGAWWLCPHETHPAVAAGLTDNLIWGSDYPHLEGTWRPPVPNEASPQTQRHLRYAFGGLPHEAILKMAGANGARVYGLDMQALRKVAARINAMTLADMRAPLREEEITYDTPGIVYPFRKNWSWS